MIMTLEDGHSVLLYKDDNMEKHIQDKDQI